MESIALFGSLQMAERLHSLNVLNSESFRNFSNLRGLSNIHLASILVYKLSYDLKSNRKYINFLKLLKGEPKLQYVYYYIIGQSKLLIQLYDFERTCEKIQ